MSDQTPRLAMPYIIASQSQKEVTHNTALNDLDMFTQTVIETDLLASPPVSPVEGQIWIVASGGLSEWAGQDSKLAQYIGGAWKFFDAFEGLVVWVNDQSISARFVAGMWQKGILRASEIMVNGQKVLGPQETAISDATGGVTVDTEGRAAINALLAACRSHGIIASS